MSRPTKKNGPVVNDLRKDLTNLLANLSLIDGDIPLASLSSNFLSGSSRDGGLDEYLSVNSFADHSSNFQTVSQISTEPESYNFQTVSQISTEPESFDSSEGRKNMFRKKGKKPKKAKKEKAIESNLDGYTVGDRLIVRKDRITILRPSVYEKKAGKVCRVTKSFVWILLDFNGEVLQKANHMVSYK